MKKRITVILLLAAALTACGGNKENTEPDAPIIVTDTDVSESVSDTKSSESVPSEETEQTESDREAGESEPQTEQTDSETVSDSTFKGSGYTLTVDPEKWTDMSSMLGIVSEYAENMDSGLNITAEQYSDMCDAMFMSSANPDVNFNITVVDLGMDIEINSEMFGPVLEQQYSKVNGCTFLGTSDTKINGYNAMKAELKMESQGISVKMLQYYIWQGGRQIAVTYTAAEDKYDELLPDFEEIINSLTVIE